jgi:hypothetical protein
MCGKVDETAWPATDRAARNGPARFSGRLGSAIQRDRNRRRDLFSTVEWCRRNDRKGTLIRHASPGFAPPVRPLPVPVIEPAFRALLVAAVGGAALPAPASVRHAGLQ